MSILLIPTLKSGRPRKKAFCKWVLLYCKRLRVQSILAICIKNNSISSSIIVLFVFDLAAPTITLHPQSTTVYAGTMMVVMSCSAVGHGTIKYQWERYLVDTNEWTTLPTGQQSDTVNISIYTLENLNKESDGVYRCGASNIDGNSYSENATIDVYGKEDIHVCVHKYIQ